MRALGVIPARLQSTRLPRKLLLDATGKPLIQYTWEAASRAGSLSEVIVATDSPEIAEAVKQFGGRAEMTGEHSCGTDRIAEVVARSHREMDVVVNIQGDEPEIDPRQIDLLVETLAKQPSAEMATLATPITTLADRDSASCTKVVCGGDGRALYFSRAPIPFCRDADPAQVLRDESPWFLHIGIYAYRTPFLLEISKAPQSRLERLEKLEQLRALEAGAAIQVAIVAHRAVGIDTPEDYARFVARKGGAIAA
jgi:3-deoxy-manno-octulosonate cytidylyltransferase (CMP-KDO synthetase)